MTFIKGRPGSGKDWASGKALAKATLTILLTLQLLKFDSENETLAAILQS